MNLKNPGVETGGNHNTKTEIPVSLNNNVPSSSFSNLEKVSNEITDLRKENLDLKYELALIKTWLEAERKLAQIEKTVYSGIKKYFKKEEAMKWFGDEWDEAYEELVYYYKVHTEEEEEEDKGAPYFDVPIQYRPIG